MIISHRGNLKGRNSFLENFPWYVDSAIRAGFRVEVDLRIRYGKLYLGHDRPQFQISENFLSQNSNFLVIHAKDVVTASKMAETGRKYNWFYHTDEKVVQTSWGWLWTYPGVELKNGIVVLPEATNPHMVWVTLPTEKSVAGICTDYPILCKEIWDDDADLISQMERL